jgi:hypothetical protein
MVETQPSDLVDLGRQQSYSPGFAFISRRTGNRFMHMVMVTSVGLVLLGLFLLLARSWGADPSIMGVAAKAFIPVWLTISLVNLWIGVQYAGYTVMQELPILGVIFGIPAAAAIAVIRRYGAH